MRGRDFAEGGRPRALLIAVFLGLGACSATPAVRHDDDPDAAYRTDFYAKQGFYASVRGHHSRLEGEFDGDTTLVGPDTIFIPDTDDGSGYEVAVGVLSEGVALELSYTDLEYDGDFAGAPIDVHYRNVSLNAIGYGRANSEVQPYALVGLLFPWAVLEDGSTDGMSVGDADLKRGFGVNLGAGVSYFLTPSLALDFRGLYTWQWFKEADGVSGSGGEIDDELRGWSWGASVGLTWILGGATWR